MASYSVNARAVSRAKGRIDARQYVLDCLDTNWISSNGKYIAAFEEANDLPVLGGPMTGGLTGDRSLLTLDLEQEVEACPAGGVRPGSPGRRREKTRGAHPARHPCRSRPITWTSRFASSPVASRRRGIQ